MSQRAVAQKSGVSRGILRRGLNGTVSFNLTELERVVRVLGYRDPLSVLIEKLEVLIEAGTEAHENTAGVLTKRP